MTVLQIINRLVVRIEGIEHDSEDPSLVFYNFTSQKPLPGFQFEAAWGPEGAVCVRKVRWPDLLSLEALAEVCPRLRGKLGEACSEAAASTHGQPLIFNESR